MNGRVLVDSLEQNAVASESPLLSSTNFVTTRHFNCGISSGKAEAETARADPSRTVGAQSFMLALERNDLTDRMLINAS